jgi:hypothetical protein
MSLTTNISPSGENTELLTIFRSHFTGALNLARIRFICLFIKSICKVKSVNFAKLSLAFATTADAANNYRRIQRFMAGADLPMKLIAKLIFSLLPQNKSLVLVTDRPNWISQKRTSTS